MIEIVIGCFLLYRVMNESLLTFAGGLVMGAYIGQTYPDQTQMAYNWGLSIGRGVVARARTEYVKFIEVAVAKEE